MDQNIVGFGYLIVKLFVSMCRTVTLKDAHSGEVRILYNARAALCKLKTPFLKDTQVSLSLFLTRCVFSLSCDHNISFSIVTFR